MGNDILEGPNSNATSIGPSNPNQIVTTTKVDGKTGLDVADVTGAAQTMYQAQVIAENRAYIQANAVYGFIPSNFRTFLVGTGTATTSDNEFTTTSGTSLGDYGTIRSFRSLNFKYGQCGLCKFAARFPENLALTWQGVGLFNLGDELSFGYNGTDFGVWHRYNGKAEIRTLTVTTPAGGSEDATVTINGTAYTVPLTSGTVELNAKEIADYLDANATGYEAYQNEDTVEVVATSDGAKSSTWSFSSSTATASFARTTEGVTKTSDFVTQANFNGHVPDGFDPSKLNSYEIQYTFGGDIKYYIFNSDTGRFLLAHTVMWVNNNDGPNLYNPSLHAGLYATSIGATTAVQNYCTYISAYSQGTTIITRNPRAVSNTKSVGTTLTNILTIRNRKNYNGVSNQVEIEPVFLTIASESSKNAVIELRGNPTVSGDTNFSDVGTNLVSEIDTDGTTVSGGRALGKFTVSNNSPLVINLAQLGIRQPPTLRLVVCGNVTSGASANLTATLTYLEDI
jgi:hypothetical protein